MNRLGRNPGESLIGVLIEKGRLESSPKGLRCLRAIVAVEGRKVPCTMAETSAVCGDVIFAHLTHPMIEERDMHDGRYGHRANDNRLPHFDEVGPLFVTCSDVLRGKPASPAIHADLVS